MVLRSVSLTVLVALDRATCFLLLFNIAEDFISRYVIALCRSNAISTSLAGHKFHIPFHLFYADDVLLFCTATKCNIESFKFAFDYYSNLCDPLMVILFCSDSVGAQARSGPAHLMENLQAFILDSAPDFNPSLTGSSDVITYFSAIDTINFFLIFPCISRSFISW